MQEFKGTSHPYKLLPKRSGHAVLRTLRPQGVEIVMPKAAFTALAHLQGSKCLKPYFNGLMVSHKSRLLQLLWEAIGFRLV
ncbi:hypothetical protein ABE607_17745 [Comamonas aquatica]|uniref:hypothetical protein n=1 Tax=Comamonas aquatica TaxID=225991 RepID=UPI003208E017